MAIFSVACRDTGRNIMFLLIDKKIISSDIKKFCYSLFFLYNVIIIPAFGGNILKESSNKAILDPQIFVRDIVAIGAVIISAIAILVALTKERALRKKEIADRVRQSTALVIAKLDRWKQIALQTFDQLQTAATEADGMIISSSDELTTRDFFWKSTVAANASLAKSILDEQIEVAYSNLYGYDPRIHDLFTGVVVRLRHISTLVFVQLLNRTQHDILTLRVDGEIILSAQLGNRLRRTLLKSRSLLEEQMELVLSEFRKGMINIVYATDEELVNRIIAVPSSSILPNLENIKESIYSAPADDLNKEKFNTCDAIFGSAKSSEFGSKMLDPGISRHAEEN